MSLEDKGICSGSCEALLECTCEELSMTQPTEISLLIIRDLIASKEFETAKANYELHHYGHWMSDHDSVVQSLELGIAKEFEKVKL